MEPCNLIFQRICVCLLVLAIRAFIIAFHVNTVDNFNNGMGSICDIYDFSSQNRQVVCSYPD